MISNSYISNLTQNSNSALSQSKLDSLLGTIKNLSSDEQKIDGKNTEVEIMAAFEQYEGLFLSQLYKLMFNTVPVNELFGGGFAEETFRDMLVDEYGTIIAKQGGIGIADNLQKTLLNLQLSGGENDEQSEQQSNQLSTEATNT